MGRTNGAWGGGMCLGSQWRNPEGKRPIGRPRHRQEGNMKKDLNEIGCQGMDWIDFTQDRNKWLGLVNTVMYVLSILNYREFLD